MSHPFGLNVALLFGKFEDGASIKLNKFYYLAYLTFLWSASQGTNVVDLSFATITCKILQSKDV